MNLDELLIDAAQAVHDHVCSQREFCSAHSPTAMAELLRERLMSNEPGTVDMGQYEEMDVWSEPILRSLLTMPLQNMNEAMFMLHISPRIAQHLAKEGFM